MSNWFVDKVCPECKGKLATDGREIWCVDCAYRNLVLIRDEEEEE
jgi:DNA-directed RNA polymerase subunit RPC12/RpoP